MSDVYDLHKYSGGLCFNMGTNETKVCTFSTSIRSSKNINKSLTQNTCITYNKLKKKVLRVGDEYFKARNNDDVEINLSTEKMYQVFKKDNNTWNQDDLFLLRAVEDFIRLSIEKCLQMEISTIDNTNAFHYVFIVPSGWEEGIREDFIRPMFVRAGLITNKDHKDRLLFCSNLEAICYSLTDSTNEKVRLERGNGTVLCRITPIEEDQALIKLDLISNINSLFDFSGSLTFPNVLCSNSFSLTLDHIKNGVKAAIRTGLLSDVREEIIDAIAEAMYNKCLYNTDIGYEGDDDSKENNFLMRPLIINTSKWDLNAHQESFLRSICSKVICEEIEKTLFNNLRKLLCNDSIKDYTLLILVDDYSCKKRLNPTLLKWSKHIMEYNRISFSPKNIIRKSHSSEENIYLETITNGAIKYVFNAVQNSDMYSKPRILPIDSSSSLSSIFLESKPEAIINIDILFDSTLFSLSFLDKNGLVKDIWNQNHFQMDTCARSLGSFFDFSEVITLNVKNTFIAFVEGRQNSLFDVTDATIYSDVIKETVLRSDDQTKSSLVSTQQKVYIKAFIHIYMIYIKNVVTKKLENTPGSIININIGYAVTIERLLLNKLFETKENLSEIIHASGLIQKNSSSKKLRIITQGEGLLPAIQQSLKLKSTLKYFFVLAQLHENYIQLTLNQVVTEEEKDQEAIIIQDEIIYIPNIYDSLCLNMWNAILKDSSLIRQCHLHKEYNGSKLLKIFSVENQTAFTKNFKQYISKNILAANANIQINENNIISLSESCNCSVRLALKDIVYVSFLPVLQNIVFIVSNSLINNQLFGKYRNIQYLFHLIHFNSNPQFQKILIKILKDETSQYTYEKGIDIPHHVIPKPSDLLLRPTLQQYPLTYHAFRFGALYHVYDENYGFSFVQFRGNADLVYKRSLTDKKSITVEENSVFSLFKKKTKVSDRQTNRPFYLNPGFPLSGIRICMLYSKFETYNGLWSNDEILADNTVQTSYGPIFYEIPYRFQAGCDIPFVISIGYEAYSSSLSFSVRLAGKRLETAHVIKQREPMTLCRF